MALPPKLYQFLVASFASVGSILYGYDLGVIAGVTTAPSFISLFNANAAQTGAVVSVFTGGAFFGAGFAGVLGDVLGRKYTIMMGAIIFLLGGGLQTGAQSLNYLYAGRAFAGLGVGFLVMIIPLYQAELCHPSIRGRVTALQQFMLGIGALLASWTAFGAWNYPDNNSKQWRLPLGLQLIPAGILAVLILLFPESPRWLIDHGRSEEGLQTLARLHARGDVNDAFVRAEYEQIQDAITFEHENEAKSYVELFKNRSSFRRLFMACAVQASVQMTGVSAIQYYSVEIFEQIGIPGDQTLKYQGISSVIALIAEMLCMTFIDYTGRRKALIWGNLVNSLTFLIGLILLAKYPPGSANNSAASWGFIAMIWVRVTSIPYPDLSADNIGQIFQLSFSYGCGPLSWIVPVSDIPGALFSTDQETLTLCIPQAEVFDTRTRSKGVAIATMVSFAFNTMIGQVTDVAMVTIRWRYYILFVVR